MKVLVISTNRNSLPVPVMPAGACIVAEAAERAGHRANLLDLMFEQNPLRTAAQEIGRMKPDTVGLSIRNIDNNDIRNPVFFIRDILPVIAAIRRETDAPIVLGGAAIAVMPEEIMRAAGITCAVTGDGETVFPELLRNLSDDGLRVKTSGTAWIEKNVFRKNPPAAGSTPCICPAPDFKRWVDTKSYLSQLATVPLQTKLGCHFQCVYCTYRKIEGACYRLFTLESVLDAVSRYASSGLRDIEFVDNVFNSPPDHALRLCEELVRLRAALKVDVRFQSLELNPFFVDDTLISLMEKAGFSGIGITLESASDRVLAGLRKGFTTDEVFRTAEVVRRHSLPCVWIFMLGGPGETEATVRETLCFAEKTLRPQDVAFFNLGVRVYPGTELETIARAQGLLSLSQGEMLPPVFYLSPGLKLEWIEEQVKKAMGSHMNIINSDSIGIPFLPSIHRIGYRLGIRPPLWRHTRTIRRMLRALRIYR